MNSSRNISISEQIADTADHNRSSAGSFTETLSSIIANGIVENGRVYAAYGDKGKPRSLNHHPHVGT